ncbi:hypothetical protein SprV_0200836100 [Sparganum proliferum]
MMARVTDNGAISQALAVTNGVTRGCVLATTLFSLMFSAMTMDAYRDELSGIRIDHRTDGHLLNSWRIQAHINPETREDLAQNKPAWRREVRTGAVIYEANRITTAKAKGAARKSQTPLIRKVATQPRPTCPRCQRTFRVRISLIGRLRTQCLNGPTTATASPFTSTTSAPILINAVSNPYAALPSAATTSITFVTTIAMTSSTATSATTANDQNAPDAPATKRIFTVTTAAFGAVDAVPTCPHCGRTS